MNDAGSRGFTLLEMVCVLALVALLANVLMPLVPRQTTKARLQAYALQAAALLKNDRTASIRQGRRVDTQVDAAGRLIRSGVSHTVLRIPADVAFEATLPTSCNQQALAATVRFFPDGLSCGGAIALSRADLRLEVRVNWLTGRIDVVPRGVVHG